MSLWNDSCKRGNFPSYYPRVGETVRFLEMHRVAGEPPGQPRQSGDVEAMPTGAMVLTPKALNNRVERIPQAFTGAMVVRERGQLLLELARCVTQQFQRVA
jgi:hypothetical protein